MKYLFIIITGLLLAVKIYSQSSWSLTGNAGTTNSNFVGTTDNNPLIIKTNSQWAGFSGYQEKNNVSFGYLALTNALGSGTGNSAFGAQALQWNSAASGNVAIGTWALEWCTEGDNNVAVGIGALGNSLTPGSHNVAIGQKALFNNKQSQNTAVGSEALFKNTNGYGLTATGFRALCNNTTGDFNTAFGFQALMLNETGFWNVALGSGSLQNNVTGRFNTAGGNSSLHFNKTGVENTAFGEQSLGGNLNGSYNTAVGCRSLWSVIHTSDADVGYGEGNSNTAVGYEALKEVKSGNGNVAVGLRALLTNNSGNFNTAIGYGADVSNDNLTNATAIGYGAKATASNQVMIGNSNVRSIRGYAPMTTISDKRIKKNIRTNIPGLAFINKLQPVTYYWDWDAIRNLLKVDAQNPKEERPTTGFLAQDVESAAKSIGYDFGGIDIDESDSNLYGLQYSSFVVPLVKAVQELSDQDEAQSAVIASLQQQVEQLQGMVDMLMKAYNLTSINNVSAFNGTSLDQNYPNPVNQSTVIPYTLPTSFNSAKIILIDTTGKILKQMPLSNPGKNTVKVETSSFPTGMYYYSLFVNDTLIDTKKMIVTK